LIGHVGCAISYHSYRAQVTCGLLKVPSRHKETWWWNEKVAEAVMGKKEKVWKFEKTKN